MILVFFVVMILRLLLRNFLWFIEIGVMIDVSGVEIMFVVLSCLLSLILSSMILVGCLVKSRKVVVVVILKKVIFLLLFVFL